MGLIEQFILPLFTLWFIGMVLVMFRSDVEFLWKITFVFIFVFYLFQFLPEINGSLNRLTANYPAEIVSWIYGLGRLSYFFLLIVWPVSLIRIFYSASNNISRTIIVTLISVTMIYWILFFLYIEFSDKIDWFMQNRLIPLLTFM